MRTRGKHTQYLEAMNLTCPTEHHCLNKPVPHFLIQSEVESPSSRTHVSLAAGITLFLPVLYPDQKVKLRVYAKHK